MRAYMKKITFGIVGTSSITHRFLRGVEKVAEVEACAIASRELKKAEAFCETYPFLTPFESYVAMLKEPSIQAVYIALPNYLHEKAILQALHAGKHVLCEKPMVLHQEEVHRCFALAKEKGLLLMEAMKPCFLPTTLKAKEWIQQGKIGKLCYLEAGYCARNPIPFQSGWHSFPSMGGGALYDIGVYPLAFVNSICKDAIIKVQGTARMLPTGADAMHLIQLQYENGVGAQLRCAIDMDADNKAVIYGEQGTITIANFWKSDTAILKNTEGTETFYEPHDASEFQYQIHAFVQAILLNASEAALMSEEESARNAQVIDQLMRKDDVYES